MDATSPRWLDSEQQKVWRVYLDGAARIDAHLDTVLRPYGLDLGEYEILVRLSEADERRMRMSDLAEAARQSRSRLTHTVARMEKKGLLNRMPCSDDRRGVIAVLTDEGYALLEPPPRPTWRRCARCSSTWSTPTTSGRWDVR